MLRLSPYLLTDNNLLNTRLMLLVGSHLESFMSVMAKHKCSPDQHAAVMISLASGLAEDHVREMWQGLSCHACELARVGLPGAIGSHESQTALERIMSLTLLTISARMWSSAWHTLAWPGQFAKLLSEDKSMATEAFKFHAKVWELMLILEGAREIHTGLSHLWQAAYWICWPAVQLTFRLLAHHGFRPHPEVKQHLQRMFTTVGDTKLIEDAHCDLRHLSDGPKHDKVSPHRAYHALANSKLWEQRGVPSTTLNDDCWRHRPTRPIPKGRPLSDLYNAARQDLPEDFEALLGNAPAYPSP